MSEVQHMAVRPASTATTYVPGGRTSIFSDSNATSLNTHFFSATVRGTADEPTPFPPPSKTEGSHHWAFERLLSASLIPLTGAAFVIRRTGYPVLDGVLDVTLVVHSHRGRVFILAYELV